MHRTLRQRFGDGDVQRRILEPQDVDLRVEALDGERVEETRHLVMIFARVRLEVRQRGEVGRFGHRKRWLPRADDPAECALHDVRVMQPVADCEVGGRRRMRFNRTPSSASAQT